VAFRARDGARVSTVARDFSLGGIRIEAPCSLEAQPGDDVELEIKLPVEDLDGYETHEPMRVRAKIVRCDERDPARAQYGMAFVGLNARAKEKLNIAIAYYTARRPEQTKASISRRLQEA
jgi:c-di-GMP-binding flagellar brake protein YcgR